ncbi:hypothetical protein DM01DRAFT_1335297 [Hesseltinella vesiculosa]|uniref:Uncharacterized protein n=1 Tax=Hesseltinella vesiculosa TaxID=101127 RepID=A0A1X2GK83_9FUNG|nr:hypothetical protein DM01DRAFT_1335297 [Hesseltinella vesiculosa]
MESQFEPEVDHDNEVDSDTVTINGFMFCVRHGLELCPSCPTDNRGSNNMMVEDHLHEMLPEEEFETKWKGDDREPFSVSHMWTRVSGKPGCLEHKQVGCKECFNWEQRLYNDIHGGKKPRQTRRGKASKRRQASPTL